MEMSRVAIFTIENIYFFSNEKNMVKDLDLILKQMIKKEEKGIKDHLRTLELQHPIKPPGPPSPAEVPLQPEKQAPSSPPEVIPSQPENPHSPSPPESPPEPERPEPPNPPELGDC